MRSLFSIVDKIQRDLNFVFPTYIMYNWRNVPAAVFLTAIKACKSILKNEIAYCLNFYFITRINIL